MGSGLIKFLTNSNIYKKLEFTIIALMLVHLSYLIIFLSIGRIYLALMNIVSILIFFYAIYIVKYYSKRAKLALILGQIEIFLHSFICAFALGWDYGFQNIILILIAVAFFTNFTNRVFCYATAFVEAVSYLFLYLYFKDIQSGLNFEADIMYLYNFILIILSLILFSAILRIFNAIVYINILDKQEELEMAANKDPLTGLYNRRAFEKIIYKNILNSNSNLSIAIGDLDDFKNINDSFGHNAGDEVIKTVSNIIKANLRKHDYAYRWGGEEFLIVLMDIDFKNSQLILNRLKRNISQNIFKFNDQEVSISITFGFVNTHISEKDDMDLALKRADELLYAGKKGGKNCVAGDILDINSLKRKKQAADI